MAATIKAIASRLNVSAASVSRALNDLPGVGNATRKKILKAAREMGYVPDSHARALVSGKVPFLALVVPDITNSFFPALALAAEEEASAAGYSLLLFNTNWRNDRLLKAVELLASRRVSGLIFSESVDELAGVAGIETMASSIVLAGVDAPTGSGLCAVCVDDVDGGRQVGGHLADCGVRTVAFVGGPSGNRNSDKRFAGMAGQIGGSAAVRIVSATSGAWTEESGYLQASELIEKGVPDAVFAANDLLALGIVRRFAENGLVPGRDFALVGYDDTDIVSWTAVPITSVNQPRTDVGRESVRRLISQLDSGVAAPGISLRPELKPRESTLAFAGRKSF